MRLRRRHNFSRSCSRGSRSPLSHHSGTFGREAADSLDPRLEGMQAGDGFIDKRAAVEASEWGIVEAPVGAAEGVAMIHHEGDEGNLFRPVLLGEPFLDLSAEEDALPGVGIVDPFVEDEHAEEIAHVGDLAQQGIGKVIVDDKTVGVDGHARAEVESRGDGLRTRSDGDREFRVCGKELLANVDEFGLRGGEAEEVEEDSGNPLIDQDTAMLGVLFALDDVMVVVLGDNEVGLCSAAHLTDPLTGGKGHETNQDTLNHMADETQSLV
jgi:hypothetical protein